MIISVMAAWPIKFTEGSKSGKKHPLPIDLSTENKKAKRSAYEKERYLELQKSPNFTEITLDITEIPIRSSEIPSRRKDITLF